jgi:histone-lysine N-methyltransferase SETMAR
MCLDYLPPGQKLNKLYFKDVGVHQIDRGLNRGRGQSRTKSMRIRMDNARVHAAGDCIAEVQRLKMTRLPKPAYSPDLSPCDFWFFGFAKQAIQDEVFDNADQLMQRLHSIVDQVTFEDLQWVFLNRMERLNWVVEHDGAYFPRVKH